MLDLDDVRWELGRFGKLNVRHGKGSRRKGPKPRLVPLINGTSRGLRWFIEDVLGLFDIDPTGHKVPLFPSERKNTDGTCMRATSDVFRRSLAEAVDRHLPAWMGKLTPHVPRHFRASQLSLAGMNLFAIQELRYLTSPEHVHATHVENCSALASYYRRKAGRSPPPTWQHPTLLSSDPVLRAAAVHAPQLGEAHGWNRSSTRCVLDGLATVLAGRPTGEHVPLSEVRTRTHRHVSKLRLAEVLADLGLLDDDTTPVIRVWIEGNTSDLAPGFAEPVRHWLLVPLDGDARAKPRSQATLYAYFGSVRPFLEGWATQYGHLREVTKTDIYYTALDPLRGYQRNNAVHAPQSLFRFAKSRRLIFTNPNAGHRPRTTACRCPGRRARRPNQHNPGPHPRRPGPAQPTQHPRRA